MGSCYTEYTIRAHKKQIIQNKLDIEIRTYTTGWGKKIEVSCLLLHLIRYKASDMSLLKLPLQYMEIHADITSCNGSYFILDLQL
jgi:hypothetical protein